MDSQYERGMFWDSRNGHAGMNVLDARPDEFGNARDTYMSTEVDRIASRDHVTGSAVVDLVIKVAA
jgi:hypothetical protein